MVNFETRKRKRDCLPPVRPGSKLPDAWGLMKWTQIPRRRRKNWREKKLSGPVPRVEKGQNKKNPQRTKGQDLSPRHLAQITHRWRIAGRARTMAWWEWEPEKKTLG